MNNRTASLRSVASLLWLFEIIGQNQTRPRCGDCARGNRTDAVTIVHDGCGVIRG